ncbi:insulinase family protein [Neptuniibacter marinus]|uniref:insulinase family protein n=1 Tax=Neptuniibacter marinus TaxID=1806670 RepID=UPI00082A28CD|nr:insulinase family protein [Neptuniibacter marinus]
MLLASIKRVQAPFLFALISCLLLSTNLYAEVDKSPIDPKQYSALTLNNQLRVLLISDPETDKAAASMNVAVGSSANPKDRAGLAHFLEHMLFLGTEKYPEADEYQNYIRSHGGGHNAYTSQENTNYFFDVTSDSLEPALDRFAQFFIAPLFNEKYVDRERHAVHSEYKAKIKDDYRRIYAATKQVMNQENSYNHFAVGNLETLHNDKTRPIRNELIDFYNQYYSANVMTLVVLGKEPLDQLEALVRSKFSPVKNRQVTEFKTDVPLFDQSKLPLQINIQTVKDIHSLTLTFPTPETRSHWKAKPIYYISSLMGYEGQGSLLSFLKEKGWATGLSASQGHDLPTESSLMINIQLTDKGEEQYLAVTQTVFQYIELLKQQGVQATLYQEEKQLSEIAFRFQEQAEPIHLVSSLASQMQRFPTELAISANYLFADFNPELIQTFLNRLTPENMLLSLKSNKEQTGKIEHYYHVPYTEIPFTKDMLAQLQVDKIDPAMTVRAPNPFIAEDLELLTTQATATIPQEIDSSEGFSLWHKTETSFNIPQADLYFTLQTPIANASPENWTMNKLYTELLQEQLNETLYDAHLAGLSTTIYPHMKGFTVRLSGYNDKLGLLLNSVINAIQKPDFQAERFEIFKKKYADSLANARKDKPYNQTTGRLYELLLPQWDNHSQTTALKNVNLDTLKAFATKLTAAPQLKVLTHGNLDKATAISMGALIKEKLLKEKPQAVPSVEVTQIPKGPAIKESLTINHNDSAISMLLQGESNSIKTRAEISLLTEILASPFYSQIRTEKQLGYIVFATTLQMNKTPAIAFIVQSPIASANILEKNIDQFMDEWDQKLLKVSDQELSQFKRSVISRITRKDNKLSAQTSRYWRELDRQETNFDTRERLAESVKKITLNDLIKCFDALQNRRLIVSNTGNKFTVDAPEKPNTASELFNQLKAQHVNVPEA